MLWLTLYSLCLMTFIFSLSFLWGPLASSVILHNFRELPLHLHILRWIFYLFLLPNPGDLFPFFAWHNPVSIFCTTTFLISTLINPFSKNILTYLSKKKNLLSHFFFFPWHTTFCLVSTPVCSSSFPSAIVPDGPPGAVKTIRRSCPSLSVSLWSAH